MNCWLMKSEPSTYGIDDLARDRVTPWDGVRNYQVRNMMRDEMRKGDLAFFYHSSCPEPGIAGLMVVDGPARPDPAQFDPRSKYYDPRSRREEPTWLLVDVRYRKKFKKVLSLAELKRHDALSGLPVLRRGNRLSITPVGEEECEYILDMAGMR